MPAIASSSSASSGSTCAARSRNSARASSRRQRRHAPDRLVAEPERLAAVATIATSGHACRAAATVAAASSTCSQLSRHRSSRRPASCSRSDSTIPRPGSTSTPSAFATARRPGPGRRARPARPTTRRRPARRPPRPRAAPSAASCRHRLARRASAAAHPRAVRAARRAQPRARRTSSAGSAGCSGSRRASVAASRHRPSANTRNGGERSRSRCTPRSSQRHQRRAPAAAAAETSVCPGFAMSASRRARAAPAPAQLAFAPRVAGVDGQRHRGSAAPRGDRRLQRLGGRRERCHLAPPPGTSPSSPADVDGHRPPPRRSMARWPMFFRALAAGSCSRAANHPQRSSP